MNLFSRTLSMILFEIVALFLLRFDILLSFGLFFNKKYMQSGQSLFKKGGAIQTWQDMVRFQRGNVFKDQND